MKTEWQPLTLMQAWREAKQYYWCRAYMNAFNIAQGAGCTEAVSKYIAESWADRDTEWQFRCPNKVDDVFQDCDEKCHHREIWG